MACRVGITTDSETRLAAWRSERLGHSSVSITTDIYAHALPGWQRQAADAFAQAMEG